MSSPGDEAARLAALQARIDDPALPPVRDWHPTREGVIDIRIAADGQWHHEGRPIRRERLVRLFSRILRHDDDGGYYLVTPVEKLRIQVDDAPFTAVLLDVELPGTPDQCLHFTTNVGDRVTAGSTHRLWLAASDDADVDIDADADADAANAAPRPYLHVRDGLDALLVRSVYYQVMDLLQQRGDTLGLVSDGCFMPLAPA